MGAAAASVKAFGSDVGKTLAATDAETKKAVETVSKGALLMGAGLVTGFGVAVGAAANFEKEMSGVAAVSGATGAELRLLGESALKAGADTSFSASEAARGQAELAKAGISTADILGGALTGSLALAAAGQLDVAQAAEISAQAMNIFGLEGRDVGHIADVLAAGANKSAADVGQLGDALRQGGLVAKQTGLSFEETVATLALFADNALVGSDAGTSLKTMLQRLTPTSKESAEMMAQLGFSAYDAQGNFIGMEALAGELQSSLGGLTQEQRNTALATMFGSDAVRGANAIYEDGAAGMARYIKMVHDQGFATRSAAELTNNLAGDVERLGGSLETALIRGGSGANTVMRELIQLATGAVNVIGEMPAPLLATATGLAGISGSALLVLGGVGTLIPKLREVQLALAALGPTGVAAAGMLTTLGKAAGIAGLLTALAMSASAADEALDKIGDPRKPVEINKLAGQLTEVGSASELSEVLVASLGYSLGDLTSRIADVQTRGWLEDFVKGSTYADRAVKELDSTLASMVQGGAIDAAQTQFKVIEADLRAMGLTTEQINAAFPQFTQGMEDAEAAAKVQAAATGEAAGALQGLNQATGENIPITEEQKAAMEAAEEAAKALKERHEELASSYGSFISPMDAFKQAMEDGNFSLNEFSENLERQIKAADEWATNLKTIAARGRIDVVDELARMGPEAAGLVAAMANANEAEMNRSADAIVEGTRRGMIESGAELDTGTKIMAEIARQGTDATVASVVEALSGLPGVTADLVRQTAQGMGQTLEEARPAWEGAWTARRTVSLEQMNALLSEAPPPVRQAADTINRHLTDTNPAFAAEFMSRRGVSVEQMNGLLAEAPPPVRAAAELINRHLTDTNPGFVQDWDLRRMTSVEKMNALLAEAPPPLRAAADLINRHLADTNPEFAAQFQSRTGVSIDEMNALLAQAPPPVQQAMALINSHLAQHKPGWDSQFVERRNFAVAEMDIAGRESAAAAGRAGDGMNAQLASRLPPFRGTVGQYQSSLVTGIQAVGAATNAGGVRRDTGAARPGVFADGGIIEFYAAGGMKEAHQAQIARAGDWRVWAEPETGGEAYIPLALAKRERSTGILEEVASRFGLVLRPAGADEIADYHQGGICQHFHSGGLYVPPPHPQFMDYGEPIRPAGSGTTHNMREVVAEAARQHMTLPHHTAPPPVAGGGGFSGGNTLARVNSILGEFPGLRVTSTYRSPSANAAVGGAPNSYHMDRANPAVDVGGPTAQLDRYAARLRSMGGWREGPIWRAPGHYDHVHVAEEGAIFKSYDQGGWLEPGYTLAHNGTGRPERVLSLAEGGLVGDTFYGGAGSERKRRRRFSDEEGAQFDYMNRRETRATPHAYLDYGTPHNQRDNLRPSEAYRDEWKDAMRDGRTGGTSAGTRPSAPAVIRVPVNQSADNSVNLTFSGPAVKVDVSASVGADARQLQDQVLTAVNRSLGAWQDSLKMEIRSRRG